jgi:hypothetical protein
MMVVQSMADMCVCSNNIYPLLGFAQTVRRAKPRRESDVYNHPTSVPLGVQTSAETARRAEPRRESVVYTHPTSASLGVQTSASLGVQHSASLGVQTSASLGVQTSASLGVQTQQPHRGDIIVTVSPQYLHTLFHMCAYKIGFGNNGIITHKNGFCSGMFSCLCIGDAIADHPRRR